MKQFRANHVSASESGREYFQVLFEEKENSEKAYLLIQRQFEIPGRGFCYIENHALSPCGHFIACATLNRNEFKLHVSDNEKWRISFDIDDDGYEKLKNNLQVILSAPNRLEIKEK